MAPLTRFSSLRGALALGAVLLATYGALWCGGWRIRAFNSGVSDLSSYFVPKYQYAADRVAAGDLPLWNPFEFGGIPFLATIQPGVFYPPLRVAYAVLSGEDAYRVLFVVHLFVAALGAMLFARDLGVGLWPALLAAAWVTQPTWLVRVYDHPIYWTATTWIPFLLLLSRRIVHAPSARRAALLGLLAAVQAVSGYPPLVLATVYLLVLGLPFWLLEMRQRLDARRLGEASAALVAAVVVAALLASVQLVPTIELAALTNRAFETEEAHVRVAEIARLDPERIFLIGAPQLTLAATAAELWRRVGPFLLGVGLLAPLLAPARAAVWFALLAAILVAGLPFGAYRQLPFAGFIRFALEWSYIAPFVLYLLAALGLDALLTRLAVRRTRAAVTTLALLALVTAWNWRTVDPTWLTLDLGTPVPVPPVTEQCDVLDPRFRSFWPAGQLRGSLMHARVRSPSGYEQSLLPARMSALQRRLAIGNGGLRPTWASALRANPGIASRMSVKCIISTWAPPLREAGFVEHRAAGDRQLRVYVNPGALPRARLAHGAVAAASAEQALDLLQPTPLDTAILEGVADDAMPGPCASAADDRVTITQDDPETVRVATASACPGYLVLTDTYTPGWSATLDGEPVPIHFADLAFRAVRVPAGEHEVAFRYAPAGIKLGLALSCAGLALAVLLVLRRPRTAPAPPRRREADRA